MYPTCTFFQARCDRNVDLVMFVLLFSWEVWMSYSTYFFYLFEIRGGVGNAWASQSEMEGGGYGRPRSRFYLSIWKFQRTCAWSSCIGFTSRVRRPCTQRQHGSAEGAKASAVVNSRWIIARRIVNCGADCGHLAWSFAGPRSWVQVIAGSPIPKSLHDLLNSSLRRELKSFQPTFITFTQTIVYLP